MKKVDLSVLDVAAAIIAKVDVMPESTDYLCGGKIKPCYLPALRRKMK